MIHSTIKHYTNFYLTMQSVKYTYLKLGTCL